jgi:hypothetical protein
MFSVETEPVRRHRISSGVQDPWKDQSMKVTKVFGLAAFGALLMLVAPASPAQAMSLSNPGAAAAVRQDSGQATTEVHWHGHHHWHRWHHRHWRHRW